MNENERRSGMDDIEEITEMLKTMPPETRKGFYYAIKGACLESEAQSTADRQTA